MCGQSFPIQISKTGVPHLKILKNCQDSATLENQIPKL